MRASGGGGGSGWPTGRVKGEGAAAVGQSQWEVCSGRRGVGKSGMWPHTEKQQSANGCTEKRGHGRVQGGKCIVCWKELARGGGRHWRYRHCVCEGRGWSEQGRRGVCPSRSGNRGHSGTEEAAWGKSQTAAAAAVNRRAREGTKRGEIHRQQGHQLQINMKAGWVGEGEFRSGQGWWAIASDPAGALNRQAKQILIQRWGGQNKKGCVDKNGRRDASFACESCWHGGGWCLGR